MDSKEITDWVVSKNVNEHWIGATKVRETTKISILLFIFYIYRMVLILINGRIGQIGSIQTGILHMSQIQGLILVV